MGKRQKIDKSFFDDHDVVKLSRQLLGMQLFTCFEGGITGGYISETEAYAGVIDKASHAYGNRRTNRTEIMFGPPGHAYVYLCYGIHHLFNIVTSCEGTPHAILIRGIYPTVGIDLMMERRKRKVAAGKLAAGPGTVSQALGIKTSHTGITLDDNAIWLEPGVEVPDKHVLVGPRIGVDYAGEDALLPYRFLVDPNYFKNQE